jgi:hypothetical protein
LLQTPTDHPICFRFNFIVVVFFSYPRIHKSNIHKLNICFMFVAFIFLLAVDGGNLKFIFLLLSLNVCQPTKKKLRLSFLFRNILKSIFFADAIKRTENIFIGQCRVLFFRLSPCDIYLLASLAKLRSHSTVSRSEGA